MHICNFIIQCSITRILKHSGYLDTVFKSQKEKVSLYTDRKLIRPPNPHTPIKYRREAQKKHPSAHNFGVEWIH